MRPLKKIDDILKSGRLHKVVKIALGGKKKNVFGDKQTLAEMMEIVAEAIKQKRFYFELINPAKK